MDEYATVEQKHRVRTLRFETRRCCALMKRAVVLRRFRVLMVIVVVVRCCVYRHTRRFVMLRVVVVCLCGQRCCDVRSLFPENRCVLLCVDKSVTFERWKGKRGRGNKGKGTTEKWYTRKTEKEVQRNATHSKRGEKGNGKIC